MRKTAFFILRYFCCRLQAVNVRPLQLVVLVTSSLASKQKQINVEQRQQCPTIASRGAWDPLICTREDVQQAIKSFRYGSCHGLLSQHLKDLTAEYLGETANSLVDALMDLLNNIIFRDFIRHSIWHVYCKASLSILSTCSVTSMTSFMEYQFSNLVEKFYVQQIDDDVNQTTGRAKWLKLCLADFFRKLFSTK